MRNVSSSQILTLGKIAVLVGSLLAIYWNDFVAIFSEAINNELTSYVLVLPFLIGYLVYRKRSALKAAISFDLSNRKIPLETFEGAIMIAAALVFYWGYSFATDALSYRTLSIPIFVGGALLTLFGKSTLRTSLFPVALFLFITPLPAELSTNWGGTLALYTTTASVAVIQVLGFGATTTIQYGNPVVKYSSLAGGQVAFVVSIACSGLYSLTGFAAFSAFAAYIPRGRLLAKISLFGIGFAVVYALNIVRVIMILMMGRYYGQGAALATFHTFAGTILIFFGTLGILILGEKVWRLKFTRAPIVSSECKHDESHLDVLGGFCSICGRLARFPSKLTHKREAGTLLIVVALTTIMLMAQVPVFAYARGPNPNAFSIPAGDTAPPGLLPTVNLAQITWTPTFQFRDQYFEQTVTNGYIAAAWIFAYYPSNVSSRSLVPVSASIELAVPGGDAYIDPPHRSEVDLQTQYNHNNSYVSGGSPQDSVLIENPYISGTLYIYQGDVNPGVHEVVYYWYDYANFRTGNSFATYHMLTTLRTSADDLLATGLITDINNSTQIQTVMQSFATQIVQYWEPVKTASVLSQYLTSIRQTLLPLLSLAIVAAGAYAGFREFTDPASASQLEAMITMLQTPEDKAFIDEFYGKKGGETVEEARLGLSTEGFKPGVEEFVAKLTAAERLGLIQRRLTGQSDNLVQRWSRPFRAKDMLPRRVSHTSLLSHKLR